MSQNNAGSDLGKALGSLPHNILETKSRFGTYDSYAALFTNPLNPTYKSCFRRCMMRCCNSTLHYKCGARCPAYGEGCGAGGKLLPSLFTQLIPAYGG